MSAYGAKGIATDVHSFTDHALDVQSSHGIESSSITFIPCDLSKTEGIDHLTSEAKSLYGRIDVLVCNAGVQGPAGSLNDITDSDWQYVMDINFKSAVMLCSKLTPDMATRDGGSIVLVSSIAGLRGNKAIGLYGC